MSNSVTTPLDLPLSQDELRTTDGTIALVNLHSQIAGQLRQAASGRISVAQGAGLVELLALRGQFLSRIADYEQTHQLAEQLVQNAPTNGNSFFVRGKTHGIFHRFSAALADLEQAEQLGMNRSSVEAARASIFQAIGHYERAFVIRQQAAKTQPTTDTLGALAVLQFERGEIAEAERLLIAAQNCYRGISPMAIAWLYFQHGHLWMHEGNLQRARIWFRAAHHRFPAYAAAQGHLAEVDAALGDYESAIALLHPLAKSSDDPDFASQLSHILSDEQANEAFYWRNIAANRYDELIAVYPEAFADHAAQFWLAIGSNPQKALQLAQKNLEVRQTPRAYKLLNQATIAYEKTTLAHA